MQPTIVVVPSIQQEGAQAALAGTRMSSLAAPMGFTFVPYRDESAERWNFLSGAVGAYFGEDVG